MKQDLYVTNVETVVPEGLFIYSQTDLKGIITEANEGFARLSGYSVAEMLGKPHNIVRHPDMPKEAFADLWKSLKEGRPWQGLVKNRRKDGGFYWVIANASPVRENGKIIGYQSLRFKPSREQIRAAEEVYEKVRNGSKSLKIEDGRALPVRSAMAGKWARAEFRLGTILSFALFASALGFLFNLLHVDSANMRALEDVLYCITIVTSLYCLLATLPSLRRRYEGIDHYLHTVLSSGNLTEDCNLEEQASYSPVARKLLMLTNWVRTTILCIQDAVAPVQESAGKIQVAINEIEQAARSQNMATASVAAASSELDLTIREVAGHLQTTESAVSDSGEHAVSGALVSEKANEKIQSLATAIRTASVEVEALGASTAEVGVIAAVIREIADQTNLLALNASIEAARAGEAGRGFAVVANEVRRLADRTMQATSKIDSLITTIKTDSDRAIKGMRAGAGQVEEGVALVQQARASLQEINERMGNAVMKVSEIATASSQQTEAMNEISTNITHVAAMSEQNVSVVHSANEQMNAMNPLVERVAKAVRQYQV
jgi:aerotaxis receptor